MTRRWRCRLMLVAGLGLLGFYLWGAVGLPDFGDYPGPYGTTIAHVVSAERQATNAVTAVVFDYRGMDTLGEELILFISVVGVATLLRAQREGEVQPVEAVEEAERMPPTSDAVRVLGVLLIGITVLVGLYVVAHGALTPGGGFQGGIVVGSGILLVYFAGEFITVGGLRPASWMELAHGAGAAGFACLGVAGLLLGGQFLHNFLPTGRTGTIVSGGFLPLANATVALEVSAAVLLLASEFLEESVLLRVERRER